MNIIYYAHHMSKYNTKEEINEINTINKIFNDSIIINPNGWIYECKNEEIIMNQCLKLVENSNILIFSTIANGVIGKGVYTEVKHALKKDKIVYLLSNDCIKIFTIEDFEKIKVIYDKTKSYRSYAEVEL